MEYGIVEGMMAELNRSLAVGRKTLAEMIDGGDHTYRTRDGSVAEIPEDQLMLIWDACDDSERIRLRLPLFVYTDSSAESGAWKVEGRTEATFVARFLGKAQFREDMVRIYHPDLKELRSKIPDAIMIVFSI